jgi:chlorophyll synthase
MASTSQAVVPEGRRRPGDAGAGSSYPPHAPPLSTALAPPFSRLSSAVELLKPVTWFAPMWALACGVVSAGVPVLANWSSIVGAVLLAGPLVCGTSQAANDWFDRHVDAINEPNRPIPSGRLPGRTGLYIAIVWTALSFLVGAALGRWVLIGIMVSNDFKAIEGDRALGIRSLPVQLGVRPAAILACVVMVLPQIAVVALLLRDGRRFEATVVTALLGLQLVVMPFFVKEPRKRAPLFNATGTSFYVAGMMVSAFAIRALSLAVH